MSLVALMCVEGRAGRGGEPAVACPQKDLHADAVMMCQRDVEIPVIVHIANIDKVCRGLYRRSGRRRETASGVIQQDGHRFVVRGRHVQPAIFVQITDRQVVWATSKVKWESGSSCKKRILSSVLSGLSLTT